jgi:hypothetical protein
MKTTINNKKGISSGDGACFSIGSSGKEYRDMCVMDSLAQLIRLAICDVLVSWFDLINVLFVHL